VMQGALSPCTGCGWLQAPSGKFKTFSLFCLLNKSEICAFFLTFPELPEFSDSWIRPLLLTKPLN
jgi:hypothetical protein